MSAPTEQRESHCKEHGQEGSMHRTAEYIGYGGLNQLVQYAQCSPNTIKPLLLGQIRNFHMLFVFQQRGTGVHSALGKGYYQWHHH